MNSALAELVKMLAAVAVAEHLSEREQKPTIKKACADGAAQKEKRRGASIEKKAVR